MNKATTTRLFLNLIRLGIGHETDLAFMFQDSSFMTVDWEAEKALADAQGLSALVLDGIEKLNTHNPNLTKTMPKIVRLQWIGEVLRNFEARYKAYEEAIGSLAGWYNAHGFKMMVLKGYACALDWPRSEHRPMGDIDIWLFGEQERADVALSNDNGIAIDKSHHHHTVFDWEGFTVENHYDFINIHRHTSHQGLEDVFKELGADDSHSVEVCGEKVYLPSANLHALFLVRHALNHFASIGVNLRQVLDWAFFVEKHGKEVDWHWLNSMLDRYHMRDFYDCLNTICVEDLGFAFENSVLHYSSEYLNLKEHVLEEILYPKFSTTVPSGAVKRTVFQIKRWSAGYWKRKLCFNESSWRSFVSGIRGYIIKPKS